jgi:hypothetical protein
MAHVLVILIAGIIAGIRVAGIRAAVIRVAGIEARPAEALLPERGPAVDPGPTSWHLERIGVVRAQWPPAGPVDRPFDRIVDRIIDPGTASTVVIGEPGGGLTRASRPRTAR